MDLQKKTFTEVATGYDPQEVDAYIAELEKKIAEQQQPSLFATKPVSEDMVERFEVMQHELEGYREIEESLKHALEAAHTATKKIQNVVEDEARKILYDANKNADTIVNEALNQSINALNYIKKMRMDARVFQKRFKILVDEQNKLTTNAIWEEVFAPIESYEVIELETIEDVIKNNKDESRK